MLEITSEEGDAGYGFDARLSLEPVTVPDPTHAFVLQHASSAFRSDDLKIALTPQGFLDSVTLESTDETADILREAVKGAAAAVKAQASLALQSGVGAAPEVRAFEQALEKQLRAKVEPRVGVHEFLVPLPDLLPTNAAGAVDLIPDASAQGIAKEGTIFPDDSDWKLHLTLAAASAASFPQAKQYTQPSGERGFQLAERSGGILVRGAEPYLLRAELKLDWQLDDSVKTALEAVSDADKPSAIAIAQSRGLSASTAGVAVSGSLSRVEQLAHLPDYAPVFRVPLERASFVKTTHALAFADGRLKSRNMNRPSSALALSKLPYDLAESVIALPTDLLQLKFDISSKQQQLVGQELELQQALQQQTEAGFDKQAAYEETYAKALVARSAMEQADLGGSVEAYNEALTTFLLAAIEANKKAVVAGLPQPFPPESFPAYK